MQFTKQLRHGVRTGRIRASVRIWNRPRVKVGGWYAMEDGHIVVESIESIRSEDVTDELARETGFDGVEDLLAIAKHGQGQNIYLVRFRYEPAGARELKGPRPRPRRSK